MANGTQAALAADITGEPHLPHVLDPIGLPPRTPWAEDLKSKQSNQIGDKIYTALLAASAISILIIIIGLAIELTMGSKESIGAYGFGFLTKNVWDPGGLVFGALPFILGTLYSSFWALLIAIPLSLLAAIFLAELAPDWLSRPLSFLIELLAAIPSVVYGLWGLFVLQPWLVKHVEMPISESSWLSKIPIFGDTANGYDMFSASVILAIMVIPYITAVSRDIMRAIPRSVREGSYALGATKWETIREVVLPYARAGFIGAVMLGFGRALGETMAVTMVIGNSPVFKPSLFSSGYTMASVIANELAEASGVYRSALVEIGLTLFVVTMIVNVFARLLVKYTAEDIQGGSRKK
jgi:phosphate transport system permease protein